MFSSVPVARSFTMMSRRPLLSPSTNWFDVDSKATKRPSDDIDAFTLPSEKGDTTGAVTCVPSWRTETRTVTSGIWSLLPTFVVQQGRIAASAIEARTRAYFMRPPLELIVEPQG